jgi:hypothetical protein
MTTLVVSLIGAPNRDHRGVSNERLTVEDEAFATKYRNQSVAEQNSLDLAWNLLMEDKFIDLRSTLFTTGAELKHFRQVRWSSVGEVCKHGIRTRV